MADEFAKLNNWIDAKGDTAIAAIRGAVELYKALKPTSAARTVPLATLFVNDPIADRAIADAVGVAAIAGRSGVSVEDILTAANLLKGVALLVTALV